MDGSVVRSVATVGSIIESGMKKNLDFNIIRSDGIKFLKKNDCYALGTERLGEKTFVIMVHYWDKTGQRQTESFDEWADYTKAHPVSTW